MTSSGEEVFFKIKRNTKLSKLQLAYANKVGKDVGSIRYVRNLSQSPRACAIRFWHSGLIVFLLSVPPQLDRARVRHLGICRFLYDGNRINDEDTPTSLDMEDNGQCSPSSLPTLLSLLFRHADSNPFVGDHIDTIDVMVERPWFSSSTSLVHRSLTYTFEQRSEDVDKVPTLLYVSHRPPCYRCTYALLPYLHSSLSSVQPAITPATLVATKGWPMRTATIRFSRSVDRTSPNRHSDRLLLHSSSQPYLGVSHGQVRRLYAPRYSFDGHCDGCAPRYRWSSEYLLTHVSRTSGTLKSGCSAVVLLQGTTDSDRVTTYYIP